jgi:hypothetical protein
VVHVSRAKGLAAPAWVAAWLQPWFPGAEKTPNSRPGRDILGTPGLAIEIKTGAQWRPRAWMAQAAKYAANGELAVLVYLPPGCGAAQVGKALAIVPLEALLPLAVAAGYAPQPVPAEGPPP